MTPLLIISVYLALLLGLGVFSSRLFRGTSSDYMLASHSIGPVLLLLSLFGTTMTAFALVGSTGKAYEAGIGVYGMLASSSGIMHSLCFFFLGVRLWRLGRRHGHTTQIQFFRDRLDSDGVGLALFPVLVGLVIPYLLIGVMSSGAVINEVTKGAFPDLFVSSGGGVPPWLASLVICVVVLIYVFFGGMRGTAWANAFQTAVFMILGVVTFFVIAYKLGGKASLLENLQVVTAQVSDAKLSRAKIPQLTFLSFMLIPLSVGMFPHVFQHWLTARRASAFKLPVILHPLFILIVWAPCVLVGVWATTPAAAVPASVHPNGVLAYLVSTLAGDVLAGLLTAGILAAIMSSLDSQFLCLGTMFTKDILLHYGDEKQYSEAQKVWIARSFIVGIVAVTYLLSLLEPRRVFDLGIWCFSGYTALFPLAVAALYWKRLTKAGAFASIAVTVVLWCYFFYQSDFAANPRYSVFGMLPVATLTAASTLALVVVSLITHPPSEKTLARYFAPKR